MTTTQELLETHRLPEQMPKVILGRSGLEVSVLGWGAPGTGGDPSSGASSDVNQMEAIWQILSRRGGNFLDTAPSYGPSEAHIGQHLCHHRGEFLLATKTHPVDADKTLRDLEHSLELMKTDAIDLFYAPHGCWDEERLSNCFKKGGVIEGGLKAVERGLARHLAFSFDYFQGLDIKRLRELIDTDVFEVVQLPYCLVNVEPVDEEILPYAREKGMGIIANFPTISGLTAREWGVFYGDFEGIVDTPGQASLLSILCHPDIHCVLTKLSSTARAEENCFAGRRFAAMTTEEKQEIRRRVTAKGSVRFLQRDTCPKSPPELSFRRSMIYFDLFTRFGFAGARPVVEQFLQQLERYPDFQWDETASEAIQQVKRTCPVMIT
ncbi:MAG: aldo/keto reductase [Armatimonadetes bacterium]|nr:aldo/keto reductase [Armatimonadota bacterium]